MEIEELKAEQDAKNTTMAKFVANLEMVRHDRQVLAHDFPRFQLPSNNQKAL